ncbi:MAG: hypothetical protein MK085_01725 [Phycisphaerales bacterium]|nr:hypothetical protein [Phycisphaerales bacterium]
MVISLIVVLVGLVLFGMSAIRQTARGLQCLNNQRELMSGWTAYAIDNSGRYVGPDTNRHNFTEQRRWDWVYSGSNGNVGGPHVEYIPGTGYYAEKLSALSEGRLYPYIGDTKIYISPFEDTGRVRSYSLSSFLTDGEGSSEWGGPPSWRVGTVSRVPKPAETINVVAETDHRGHNINGWGIRPNGPTWIDKLAIFDPGYFNFAFIDGHTERYKYSGTSYTDPDRIEVAFSRPQTDVYYPGPDYDWIQKRLFPGSRAIYGDW